MCSPSGMPSTEDCVVTLAKPANDAAAAEPTTMTVQLIGGPTAVFEIGGVRVLSLNPWVNWPLSGCRNEESAL